MSRLMTARYDGTCTACGLHISAGTEVRFNGRGRGIRHRDNETCAEALDAADYEAENRQERELEMQAEYRMAGLSQQQYYEDRDYERGVRVGNDRGDWYEREAY